MKCAVHGMEVMGSNPSWVELEVHSISVKVIQVLEPPLTNAGRWNTGVCCPLKLKQGMGLGYAVSITNHTACHAGCTCCP